MPLGGSEWATGHMSGDGVWAFWLVLQRGALASPLLKWRPLELASTSLAACFAAVDRVANQMPFIATQFQLKCRYFQHIQLGWQILVEQMMLVGRDPRGRLLQRNLSSKIVNPFEKKSQLIKWFLLQGWTHYLRCLLNFWGPPDDFSSGWTARSNPRDLIKYASSHYKGLHSF